jgi:exodeoxyribonuclease VII large subunit
MDSGTLTVGQLAEGIDTALSSWFGGELWVQGEIDSLRRSNNGHVYFHLVERGDDRDRATASIDVTLFDAARRHVNAQLKSAGGVRMTNGMQVRLRGRLEYYAPQGRIQLRMSGIDPAYTLALLVTERDRVLALLEADGLTDRNRRTRIPSLPLRVGLVTSEGSAAMGDFVHELEMSGFAWRICAANVPVQGRGADRIIAKAIEVMAAQSVDVIVVVRGGGSRMDLATFDSEALARAVAAAALPVLTGIGHEIDTSVADVVAHTAFKTPTACAAALVTRVREWLEGIDRTWGLIPDRVVDRLDRCERRLDRDADDVTRLAAVRIGTARRHVDSRARHIHSSARHQVLAGNRHVEILRGLVSTSAEAALRHAQRQLLVREATVTGADPVRLMQRGWSITRTEAGEIVRDAEAVGIGDRLVTTLSNGVLESEVSRVGSVADDTGNHDGR